MKLDLFTTERFTELNLVKPAHGGLIIGSSQFQIPPQLPQKMRLIKKSGQKRLENNHLAS